MDSNSLERMLIKACMVDRSFVSTLSAVFLPEYLDDPVRRSIYTFISEHYRQYSNIPEKSLVIANCDSANEELEEIDSIDLDVARNHQYIFDQTNIYLKEHALKKAILESVDIISKKGELGNVRSIVDTALSKDLKIDLGLDYFTNISERLRRMFNPQVERVPSYYPLLDEYISGGFPPYTLSIFAAAVHGFKSAFMANLTSRQVQRGYNIALASMEMSEDMFAQRFDALFTNKDINRIYVSQDLKTNLLRTLKELKENPNTGKLFIKQFPTGATSVLDIRAWLRELQIRGILFHILYVDYINLMKPSYLTKGELYGDVKRISEELRALSFEFGIPVVSVTQLNREGMRVSLSELDFTYLAESIGTAATADSIFIFGDDEDSRVYSAEIGLKTVKNRLGGRIGDIIKMYSDSRSLRMYDASELDLWLQDASVSGDERSIADQPEPEHRNRQQPRGGRR